MKWNLPNILTLLRLVAAPGVAVMFLYFTRPYADWFALVLFVSAAVTDWFDGYLARAWGQETKLGAMLDPIADKAMVVIALMVIVAFSSWSPWLVLPTTTTSGLGGARHSLALTTSRRAQPRDAEGHWLSASGPALLPPTTTTTSHLPLHPSSLCFLASRVGDQRSRFTRLA